MKEHVLRGKKKKFDLEKTGQKRNYKKYVTLKMKRMSILLRSV
jgi:hypothetical protein